MHFACFVVFAVVVVEPSLFKHQSYVAVIAVALSTASRSLTFVDSVIVVLLPLQGSIIVTIVFAIFY